MYIAGILNNNNNNNTNLYWYKTKHMNTKKR